MLVRYLVAAAVAVAAVFGAMAYFVMGGGKMPGADAGDPDLVAMGATVYRDYCASCHGADLKGEENWRARRADGTLPAPPHDATGHTWHHADGVLFDITKRGPGAMAGPDYKSTMPGFEGTLDDRQIWASLAYIKSRWPAKVAKAQEQANQRARN